MAKKKVRPEDEQPSNRALSSKLAPTKSKRPPKKMPMFDAPSPREEEPTKKAYGGKVMKKAKGGMCRGMGAAKRGGSYKAM